MDRLKIISNFLSNDFTLKNKRILIFGKTYPFFLFNFFREFFNKNKPEVKIFSFEEEKESFFFKSELELDGSDFFFNKIFFYDNTEKKDNLSFFNKNFSAIVYSEKDIQFQDRSLEIEKIDSDIFLTIDSINFFNELLDEREKLYSEILLKKFNKLRIEKFFYLLLYSKFLKGKSWNEFFSLHEAEINKEKYSLFDLATSFFKRDEENFYFLWNLFKNDYEVEFWNSYWLKQLLQAFKFLILNGDLNLKWGLPFWFIKNGKRIYNKELFLNMLKELYLEIAFFRENNFDLNDIFPCEKIFFFWFIKK